MYHRYPEQMIFTKLFTPIKFDEYNAAVEPQAVVIRA